MESLKKCKDCGESKPLGDFPKGKGYKDGIRPRCKPCHYLLNKKHVNHKWFADWRKRNRESTREYMREYSKIPEQAVKKLARTRNRQAMKKNATPKWANQDYIRLFYEGAKIEAARIGEPVDVDHIVPLQHPLVCGLHCEQNLQLLVHKENLAKANTFLI